MIKWPGLDRAETRNQELLWVSHVGVRVQVFAPFSATFLGVLAGREAGSGTAGTPTGAHMRCWGSG